MRTLCILDIENLAGCGRPGVQEMTDAIARFDVVSGRREGEMTWVSVSSASVLGNLALMALEGVGITCLVGRDGAERAIDQRLDWAWVAETFTHVVIGSGDAYFAPIMAALAGAGVDVTVIGRWGAISAASRMAAHRWFYLTGIRNPLVGRAGDPHAA